MAMIRLIPREYRPKGVLVAILVPVSALIDLFGVAALLPVMMLLLDKEAISGSFLMRIYESLGFASQDSFALFVCLLVLVLLVVKSVLSILISTFQNKYMLSLYRHFSSTLFDNYYNKGLVFVKQSNSSEMTFNINAVCYNFVVAYLGGYLRLFGAIAFTLLMLVALLVYNPLAAALSLASFVPALAVYLLLVRKPLVRYGTLENNARRQQYRLVQETFRGYPEIEVSGAYDLCRERFDEGLRDISKYRVRSGIIQAIPSFLLEIVIVAVVAVLLMLSINGSDKASLVFLGVFSVAMLKLMPAVRSIISSWSAIKATRYTSQVVAQIEDSSSYREMGTPEGDLPFEQSIEMDNVSFAFDSSPVIDRLSIVIHKGERVGIKGRTGAGKTTLFNLLLGLYAPQEGSVRIDGTTLDASNVALWHRKVGYVPQDVFITDSTIAENVALGRDGSQIDRERVIAALEQASLMDFINSLPKGIDTRIGEAGSRISGGQRQRLGIARALYKGAEVLFFDEATSSLDSQTESEVNEAIRGISNRKKELTIIVISHRQSTLDFCDRVIEI